MRKRKKSRKLSLKRNQRKALLKALLRALFLNEKIKTSEAKAKEVASLAEKYISRAGTNTLHIRRMLTEMFEPKLVKKLVEEIGPRYKDRPGGYTRIIKLGPRGRDGARMAIVELV